MIMITMEFGIIGLGNHAINRVMPAIKSSGKSTTLKTLFNSFFDLDCWNQVDERNCISSGRYDGRAQYGFGSPRMVT